MKKVAFIIGSLALLLTLGVGASAYHKVGKTPGEIMDYLQVRLQGHPKLEWFALPIIAQARVVLEQPSKKELLQIPFLIPKLPAWQPSTTSVPEPAVASSGGRVLRVGRGQHIATIAQAARMAQDGDVVEIEAGEYYGDVALWLQKKLTIRAVNGRARLYAMNKTAEGKAIWVFRHGDITIENIEFVGAKAGDHNGGGIRFEGGSLKIVNCLFYGNQNGILVNEGVDNIEITKSEFGYNGHGDGLSHNLYVGLAKELRITHSYFHHANVGHHIKSRAAVNYIYYNRITDEAGGRASYELDFANGGVAYVVGNVIQQDSQPQNSTIISYAAEGSKWPVNKLYIASNTIVNDNRWGGSFVKIAWPVDDGLMANNLFSGDGSIQVGVGELLEVNNHVVDWGYFRVPSRYDYDFVGSNCKLKYQDLADQKLIPLSSYIGRSENGSRPRCVGSR